MKADQTTVMKKMQKPPALLIAALMTGVIAAACGGSANAANANLTPANAATAGLPATVPEAGTGPSGYSVPPGSLPDGESRLYVKFEGTENSGIPIRNGGLVHLGGGLDAEIFIDPYPTDSLTAWLDLYLEMDGRPVSDARTVILYDMWSMGHGPYVGKSDAATDGHYVFRLDYIMFGAWEQVLEIRMPGTDEVQYLTVIVVAVP